MVQILKNCASILVFIMFCMVQNGNSQSSSQVSLEDMFYDYSLKSLDSKALSATARDGGFFTVEIPNPSGGVWSVELHDSKVIGDDYISRYTDESGVKVREKTKAIATKGTVAGNLYTSVSLTFNEGFVYGYIKDKTGYNYIEPAYYYDDNMRGKDLFVIYKEEDVKPTAPKTCGTTEIHERGEQIKNHKEGEQRSAVDECFEVEWAIANDFLMFSDFGSVSAVENHAIGVANNVQTNYDDEFADELQLIIVEQFTATSAATDPWTTSTNASVLLNDFRSWGPSGFSAIHDIGALWTDRNFDGSTIGIAYVGVVCTGSRYSCLQNFTNNAETKRVMVAHEIGHNFASGHDAGSGHIMAPSVSSATTWSAQSISAIDNHVASRWCLDNCTGGSAPVANFEFVVIEECTVGEVVFINNSTGTGLEYDWSFPGGVPSTSTLESPSVQYPDGGVYDATLTVTNAAGSDESIQNNIFTINPSPLPNFSFDINGTITSFFNFSQDADSYFWDFGDGFTSTESDPVHDFIDDGVYTVILTASNFCGDVTTEQILVIATPPTAGFIADVQEGCEPLTVEYTSNSSNNTDDFVWTFEGGNPGTSTAENPVVSYDEAGEWDVTLTVINETGDDILQMVEFINVIGQPVSDFEYTLDGNVVTFENFSEFGDSFIWTFGDGESSTEEEPTHTYASDGTYAVVLTVENECGSTSVNTEIEISLAPSASFSVSGDTEGCAPMTVNYENTSTNSPDTYEWVFEGGTPAMSTEADPEVVYAAAGTYDVILTVTNANGSNSETFVDYITINDEPSASFDAVEDGLQVSFVDQSSEADSYSWDFGDGNTSIEANPVHTYSAEGIYTVVLEVSNECGISTEMTTINNYTPVSALFSSDITSGCANLEVGFTDQSSSNVTTWFWTFEGGTPSTSTMQNPIVTYETAGQYDVILVVSHPESEETITLVNYVAVSDVPVPSFEYFDDQFEVEFTNTTVEGVTYSWDFGDGNSSSMENPTHTYGAEGTYEVVLTATNACGTITSSESITINALPTAGFSAVNTTGCGPLTIDFTNGSSSNSETFAWTFEGGNPATSTDENPTVTYEVAGTYGVTLVVTSEAGSDESTLENYVVVLAEPVAEIDVNVNDNAITAVNSGSDAESTSWSVEGEVFETETLEYTFPENGTYTVELTTTNECGSSTTTVDVMIDVYPEVSYSGFPLIGCVGEEILLMDNSTNAESKAWTLPNGNPDTSTENNPIVVYSEAGTYDVILSVTNSFGVSTETFAGAVTIIDLPVSSFTGVQNENTVDFTSTSIGAVTHSWDFGDGTTSDEENPSHIYTESGSYEVVLTVTNNCGEVESTETFTVVISSVTESDFASMKVYPNPASNFLTISLDNDQADNVNLSLIDVQGRIVHRGSFNSSNHTINTSQLVDGTYMLRLSTDDATFLKKVVIFK